MDVSSKRFLLRAVLTFLAIASLTIASCESREDQERLSQDADSTGELRPEGRGSRALLEANLESRHGGVVQSVDRFHVEVVSGPMRIWLYDHRGSHVSPGRVDGQIVLYRGEEAMTFALEAVGDHLTPAEQPDLDSPGTLFVELMVDDQPLDVVLQLPLTRSGSRVHAG